MSKQYHIWSNKHSVWWRVGSWGDTDKVEEVEIYSWGEAEQICRNVNRVSKPLEVEMIAVYIPDEK
ncbi:MAG: hypothetical protein HN580_11205 [Deltaproteobacteria bacterium]|jgi:hypothetical protein|nr:hypothetical protein [Deltaproteobacteria bacterium]MBT4269761.1 hypothetical protein [Deltaproteobacteria bacterium]MBT4639260.1 hypothetical protein [Deltaproteobacteria bacterium]MBT6504106.1 hypothetical protein [Deltaproteobacteria bacterium]MBT6611776.1 hypothetical protein [Deltaproteobacteria bacterium]